MVPPDHDAVFRWNCWIFSPGGIGLAGLVGGGVLSAISSWLLSSGSRIITHASSGSVSGPGPSSSLSEPVSPPTSSEEAGPSSEMSRLDSPSAGWDSLSASDFIISCDCANRYT